MPQAQPNRPFPIDLAPPFRGSAFGKTDQIKDSDLPAFAEFLSAELNFNEELAAWKSAGWYRNQIGVDDTSWEQAFELRELTIQRCKAKDAVRPPIGSTWERLPGRIDTGIVEHAWIDHPAWLFLAGASVLGGCIALWSMR